MMLDLGSPVNSLYYASNLESLSVWSLTHSELVEDLLRRNMEQLRIVYRYTLERNLADVYFLVGSELASPPFVSRVTFQRWVVPFESELIALIHSYGKKVIQHYHGQIREVLPDFADMAPDGLHTIEAPPVGNCTHTQAYDITANRITLIGNIQYDDFRSSSPAAMVRAVRDTLDEVNGRRFILSPSAGPFDPDPPQNLLDNYVTFMRAARDYRPGRL
jgi:uroporphyrinogen-III decarboxylase